MNPFHAFLSQYDGRPTAMVDSGATGLGGDHRLFEQRGFSVIPEHCRSALLPFLERGACAGQDLRSCLFLQGQLMRVSFRHGRRALTAKDQSRCDEDWERLSEAKICQLHERVWGTSYRMPLGITMCRAKQSALGGMWKRCRIFSEVKRLKGEWGMEITRGVDIYRYPLSS